VTVFGNVAKEAMHRDDIRLDTQSRIPKINFPGLDRQAMSGAVCAANGQRSFAQVENGIPNAREYGFAKHKRRMRATREYSRVSRAGYADIDRAGMRRGRSPKKSLNETHEFLPTMLDRSCGLDYAMHRIA
jgi:hypothetical protein